MFELRLPKHTKTSTLLRQCIQRVEGFDLAFEANDEKWAESFIDLSYHISLKDWNVVKKSIGSFIEYEIEVEKTFDYA